MTETMARPAGEAGARENRPVHITLEAQARPVSNRSSMLLVTVAGHSFLLDPSAEGVQVEDVVPPRTWTDGDVVQHADERWTLTRQFGVWVSSRAAFTVWTDDEVTKHLTDHGVGWGHLAVLRYQAGE